MLESWRRAMKHIGYPWTSIWKILWVYCRVQKSNFSLLRGYSLYFCPFLSVQTFKCLYLGEHSHYFAFLFLTWLLGWTSLETSLFVVAFNAIQASLLVWSLLSSYLCGHSCGYLCVRVGIPASLFVVYSWFIVCVDNHWTFLLFSHVCFNLCTSQTFLSGHSYDLRGHSDTSLCGGIHVCLHVWSFIWPCL